MKLTVQHHHLRSCDDLDSLIENRILALQPRLQIDEAHVRLECQFEESPAFSVHVHLVTPGPDVFAESRDHTIRAAIEKVLTQVEAKITNRLEKRRARPQQPWRGGVSAERRHLRNESFAALCRDAATAQRSQLEDSVRASANNQQHQPSNH